MNTSAVTISKKRIEKEIERLTTQKEKDFEIYIAKFIDPKDGKVKDYDRHIIMCLNGADGTPLRRWKILYRIFLSR